MAPSRNRYVALGRSNARALAVFLVFALLQLGAAMPQPFVVKQIFDSALPEGRPGQLTGLALLALGLQLATSVFGLFATGQLLGVSAEVIRQMRLNLFDKLDEVSIHFHETNPLGDLHDRLVHETERVDQMVRNGLGAAAPAAIFSLGIVAVLAAINWLLFLVTVFFVPVVYTVNGLSRKVLRAAARRYHASIEHFSEAALRSLAMTRQTRTLAAEDLVRRGNEAVVAESAAASLRLGLWRRAHLDANQIIVAVWATLVLTLGGIAVIDGRLTLGELLSFYAGLALIRQPLQQLASSIPPIVAGREALQRIDWLLESNDVRPYCGSQSLEIEGHISVSNVSFGYQRERPVLIDANLDVQPGEVIAIVGRNGSGKTTLVSLLLGFYRPTIGRISVDGVDYRHLDMRNLRRQFGVLSQDPAMVPGTVYENITYGRAEVPDAQVQLAIALAGAQPVIDELDNGLETRAYENGPLLSGGQMQRVALARALLGRPRVLILDEPTSHLDVEGVAHLIDGLRSIADHPAIIVITHSAQVAASADRIYRLASGSLRCVSNNRS